MAPDKADQDIVMCMKAIERLLNRPCGEIFCHKIKYNHHKTFEDTGVFFFCIFMILNCHESETLFHTFGNSGQGCCLTTCTKSYSAVM